MSEVLSLSTIVERKTINIESKRHPAGKLYELANLADIGPYEYAIIHQRAAEAEQLRRVKKPTVAQKRRTKKLLDDTVKLVLHGIEPAVLAALSDQQKDMIVVTWSAHLQTQRAAEGNAPAKPRRTTGASSRASRSSSAATRKGGSTSRRGS